MEHMWDSSSLEVLSHFPLQMHNVNRKTSTVVIATFEGELKESRRRAKIEISLLLLLLLL
jgi:hypothetical protein